MISQALPVVPLMLVMLRLAPTKDYAQVEAATAFGNAGHSYSFAYMVKLQIVAPRRGEGGSIGWLSLGMAPVDHDLCQRQIAHHRKGHRALHQHRGSCSEYGEKTLPQLEQPSHEHAWTVWLSSGEHGHSQVASQHLCGILRNMEAQENMGNATT